MHAEIIAIGSELTSGAKLDTNSQWLSNQLAAIGIPVRYHMTVADDLDAMVALLEASVQRSDLVLITGGLGPTLDDLTRQAMAGLLQTELETHQPSLEFIKLLFARRNIEMPERNNIQAEFPKGTEPIRNPRGTAPGIWAEIQKDGTNPRCQIAAMPGVPSEMRRMFEHEVLPRLPGGGRIIKKARVNCFGLGESTAEDMLGELTARGRDPEVGITVHEATITLRIEAHGNSGEECDEKIDTTKLLIREVIGDYVFGEEDDELQDVVVRLLNDRELTLSTAESGTGGLLAHRITDVPNFENCYLGGIIAPTDAAKRQSLGVSLETLENEGPISAEVAAQMAAGARRQFGTNFSLSVTECPRFDPDDATVDVPVAYVALVGENVREVRKQVLLGDPAITKSRAAKLALNLLRRHLIG